MNFRITLKGTAPLLMHNSRLANPIDPVVKDIKKYSSKRKKTDDDYEIMAKFEHRGGLYWDKDAGPYIPSENIHRCLVDAAKKQRLGKAFTESLIITSYLNPLAYKGPRDMDGLWEDKNFVNSSIVRVQSTRIVRTRPIFKQWATDVEGMIDDAVIDWHVFKNVVETAGSVIGLGDWRPRYGRFEAILEKR